MSKPYWQATLFVRLALLELALEVTAMSVTEVWPDHPDEPFVPLPFDDPRLARPQSWARAFAQPVPS